MTEITANDFKQLSYNTQKRLPGLAGVEEFYYGIDIKGHEFFMYQGDFSYQHDVLSTEVLSIKLLNVSPNISQLQITLQDREFVDVFIKLIYIVVEDVEAFEVNASDQDKFHKAITVLNDWIQMFKLARTSKLSDNRIIGLLGELIFLAQISETISPEEIAIDTWQGPHGNDEDFSFDGKLFEIKSSKSSKNNTIKINSLRQINSKNIPTFLVHQSFSSSDNEQKNSINLYDLVEDIKAIIGNDLSASANFDQKLLESGYIHDEKYLDPVLSLDATSYYEVSDDFPLIYSENIDPRIIRVNYVLDLDKCREFLIEDFKL